MNAVEIGLYSKITGTAAITSLLASATSVYNQRAPHGAAKPYVVFAYQGGGDENDSGTRRRDLMYQVRAVSETSRRNAGDIDDQLDLALHGVVLTITGWANFWISRETDINFTETAKDADKEYYHKGAVYRIRLGK